MNKAKTVYFLLIPDPCNLNYIVASTERVPARKRLKYKSLKGLSDPTQQWHHCAL